MGHLLALAQRHQLGSMPLAWQGAGTEPYALRGYLPGDPPSKIHWKATARHGRLVTREETWARGARLLVLLDAARTKPAAALAGRLFGLLVLGAGAFAGLRLGLGASRWARGAVWLGLLGAASLTSPGAWGDYVPVTAVWLLALVAAKALDDRRVAIALGVTALFQYFLLGTYPVAGWGPAALMAAVSAVGAVAMLGLFGGVLASSPGAFAQAAAAAETRAAEPRRRAAATKPPPVAPRRAESPSAASLPHEEENP